MNIYDFDGTVYDGDSTADFYFYCLKKYPSVLKTVIPMLWAFFLYILGIKTKTQFKEKMYRFLTCVKDIDGTINDFWNTHEKNIMDYYKKQHRDDDVIISAETDMLAPRNKNAYRVARGQVYRQIRRRKLSRRGKGETTRRSRSECRMRRILLGFLL